MEEVLPVCREAVGVFYSPSRLDKESESITDFIIRTANNSNALVEAGEVISDGLLTAMTLKELPSNFKLFAMMELESLKNPTTIHCDNQSNIGKKSSHSSKI